jgi:hypothetical protein
MLNTASDDPLWEYQRAILAEDLGIVDLVAGMRHLLSLLDVRAQQVEQSRAKDHTRGCRVIEDYFERHDPPADDPIVREVRQRAESDSQSIRELIGEFERVAEADYASA